MGMSSAESPVCHEHGEQKRHQRTAPIMSAHGMNATINLKAIDSLNGVGARYVIAASEGRWRSP
jgi:hypothetical protein